MRPIEKIIIHCSATSPDMNIGRAEIDKWHRQRGFLSIGYHYVIRRNGLIETGRPLEKVGAHAIGFNTGSVGICLVGGIDKQGKSENNFTPAQFRALKTLVRDFQMKYPKAEILGHRDLPKVKKDCPCFNVQQWVAFGMPETFN